MAKTHKTTTAPTGQIAPFGLRMLPELREKIEVAARESGRSMNAEIVARLEESFAPRQSGLASIGERMNELHLLYSQLTAATSLLTSVRQQQLNLEIRESTSAEKPSKQQVKELADKATSLEREIESIYSRKALIQSEISKLTPAGERVFPML